MHDFPIDGIGHYRDATYEVKVSVETAGQ